LSFSETTKRRSRRGVTLIELLLVLSLIVVIAAIAWPSIERAFDGRRLQLAAEQFRADVAMARMKAINTGRMFLVRHEPGASSYTIEPFDDGWTEMPVNGSADTTLDPQNRPADLMILQRSLPEDVIFHGAQGVIDSRNEETLFEVQEAERKGSRSLNLEQTEMFFCYPDGSTATSRFYLANRRNRCIAIDVRGLTGVATLGEVMTVEEIP
jgi:prepilin-type N-terminal cleavage/methylation domain-containing protein